MKRFFIWAVAGLIFGWVAFASLIGIDTADAVAYNQLDRHVGTASFRAGDLVSVSPDGQRVDYLCNMAIDEEDLRAARIRKSYGNWLEESLPSFAKAATWAKSFVGAGGTEAEAPISIGNRVDFNGRLLTLPAENADPDMREACICAAARLMVQRHSICMVSKSMNEFVLASDPEGNPIIEERTVGATFRESSLFIPDVQALGCEGISPAASIPAREASCPGPDRLDNVWLRDKLNVIREYDATEVVEATLVD